MLTKTKIALVAAFLIGSVSGALADPDGFDADIFRPAATANVPARNNHLNAFAHTPARLGTHPTVHVTQPLSIGEKNWMDNASQSYW